MSTEPKETPTEPFWKLRHSNAGRPKLFKSPTMLMEAANEYFAVTAERYWRDQKLSNGGKVVDLKVSPPFTLAGFCLYVGASRHWWNEMKAREEKDPKSEFLEVIRYISDVIEVQQFEGASIGAFNANIISRSLGLVEKKETEVKGLTFKVGYKKPGDEDGN